MANVLYNGLSSFFLGQVNASNPKINGAASVGTVLDSPDDATLTVAAFYSDPTTLGGSSNWANTSSDPRYVEGGPLDDSYLDLGEGIRMDLDGDGSLANEPWLRINDIDRYSTTFALGDGLDPVTGNVNIITAYDPATGNVYQTMLLGDDLVQRINDSGASVIWSITLDSYVGSGEGTADLTQVLLLSNFDSMISLDGGIVFPCFGRGTLIDTNQGPVLIEDLKAGDRVRTLDEGFQTIRWIGSRLMNFTGDVRADPKHLPIRIRAGALGPNIPEKDLIVSPQHRILVRSKIAERMFGNKEVLIAAKHLLAIDGIDIVTDIDAVEYFHILFEDHQIIYSNGAMTESLYTGPEALKTLPAESKEEIFSIFPELREGKIVHDPARTFVAGRMSQKLAMRHQTNQSPAFSTTSF